ncbi:MAG: urease subunit beta [Mycobacteriaceae bacterium]
MIPGEILCVAGEILLNEGAKPITVSVLNTADRPIQVGSHVHFPQSNTALDFDRDSTYGFRLNIAAGTAIRFEPGIRQQVSLVPIAGSRKVFGLTMNPPGALDSLTEKRDEQ